MTTFKDELNPAELQAAKIKMRAAHEMMYAQAAIDGHIEELPPESLKLAAKAMVKFIKINHPDYRFSGQTDETVKF